MSFAIYLRGQRVQGGRCNGARDACSRAACGEAPGAWVLTSRAAVWTPWGGGGRRPSRIVVTAQVRGTLSSRSVERCGHRGLCPSHKIPREGPRPRGQQEYRAQRTAPLPDIVQTWASFDIGQPERDRVPAVRSNAPTIGCCSQAGVPATRLVAAEKRCRTLCRTPTAAMELATCFVRSPLALLCVLCVSVV
jgi:hypothetical protein